MEIDSSAFKSSTWYVRKKILTSFCVLLRGRLLALTSAAKKFLPFVSLGLTLLPRLSSWNVFQSLFGVWVEQILQHGWVIVRLSFCASYEIWYLCIEIPLVCVHLYIKWTCFAWHWKKTSPVDAERIFLKVLGVYLFHSFVEWEEVGFWLQLRFV